MLLTVYPKIFMQLQHLVKETRQGAEMAEKGVNQTLTSKKSRQDGGLSFSFKRSMLKFTGKQSAGNLFHRATVLGQKLLAWNSFLAIGTSRI